VRLRAVLAVDPAQRDQLVLAHVDLVKTMAHRLHRRLPSQVEVSELVGAGVVGLIDAAGRYEPALGVPFDAFARRRIHGAMLDALRGVDSVPRSVRRLKRQAEDVMTRLRHTLNREPEPEDIALEMGLTLDQYQRMLDDFRSAEIGVARTVTRDGESTDLLSLAIDPDGGPAVHLERRELRRHLAAALTRLPPREQQVLSLSYVEELTLAEIGRVLGVGESRVSQIRTHAVMRLRSLLRVWLAPAEAH
jgi:RNA polymerase sigma factor for flagellar operon FliA